MKRFDFTQAVQNPPPGGGASRPGGAVGDSVIAEFPRHLYVPEGAEVVDIRVVAQVPPATVRAELLRFAPLEVGLLGSRVQFIGYSIYNDGLLEDDFSFLPTVNGFRVFKYHGNPQKNFLMSLGLGPDMSNQNVIACQLALQPQDVLRWYVTNNSAVVTTMGVRMIGYVDLISPRVTQRFGGG